MATSVTPEKKPPKGLTPWQWRGRLTDAVLSSFFLQSRGKSLPDRVRTKDVFNAFYQLRNQEKYLYWLGSLHFEIGEDVTISKALEDVLFTLGAFELVTVENHDFRYLRVDPKTRKAMKKQIEARLPAHQVKQLRELSNEFTELVK